jgi:hypothetical protein
MFGSKEKNARIEAFADQLIAELVQRFPVEKEAELRTSRLEPARQLGSAVNVQQEARLGIYGKARLLNRLKWELKEKGYGEAIIDLTVAEVTRMLSLRVK